jgi:hypothetical protein
MSYSGPMACRTNPERRVGLGPIFVERECPKTVERRQIISFFISGYLGNIVAEWFLDPLNYL